MQCVVLAGGLGTRMGSLTTALPKVLVPVSGLPFAHHQLELLSSRGIDRIVYCIGYRGDMVREYVGDGSAWDVSVRYVDEGANLRGTGGALRLAFDKGVLDGMFFVLYGDSYLPIEMHPVWQEFGARGQPALMTVLRNEGRWDASNVEYRGGMVVRYDKRPPAPSARRMDYIDYGLSVMARDLIAAEVPEDGVTDLGDVFHHLSIARRLAGFEVAERFYEVGSAEGLRDFEAYLDAP